MGENVSDREGSFKRIKNLCVCMCVGYVYIIIDRLLASSALAHFHPSYMVESLFDLFLADDLVLPIATDHDIGL